MYGTDALLTGNSTEIYHSNSSFNDSNFISSFTPVRELAQDDGDVSLIFLSANGIRYTRAVDDKWYSAHQTNNNTFLVSGDSSQQHYYLSDEPASVLGCKEQYQSCNPTLPPEKGCSPLGGINSITFIKQPPSTRREYALYWGIILTLISLVLDALRSSALIAKFSLQKSIQASLPVDQWQLEVENWNSITLASFQGFAIGDAVGPEDAEMLKYFWVKPSNDVEKDICKNQV